MRLSRGTLTHHLRKLEEQKMIIAQRDGKFKYFYSREIGHIPLCLTPTEKEIVRVIGRRPGSSVKEIAKEYGKNKRTVYYHIENLAAKGLVNSKRVKGIFRWFVVPEMGLQIGN